MNHERETDTNDSVSRFGICYSPNEAGPVTLDAHALQSELCLLTTSASQSVLPIPQNALHCKPKPFLVKYPHVFPFVLP